MKKLKFLLPVIIVFVVLVIIKIFSPQPTDWSQSFSKNDKIPYGSYILFEELKELFPKSKIEITSLPFYNINRERKIQNSNIIIICTYFGPDELDSKVLLKYLEEGNNIFIAANSFHSKLTDSFKVYTNYSFLGEFDSSFINFTNPSLQAEDDYTFVQGRFDHYFSSFDTSKTSVLGINEKYNPNFISIKIGKGTLFLHTLPTVFTNYNILTPNREYIFKSLSYLPDRDVIWDEYYKDGNRFQSTPLRYVLSQPALRWSYFSLLAFLIMFILLKGRRDQRIVPVIKPLANTTLEFVNTVGNLYFKQSNHKNIAEKRITYFLDYIRTKYLLKTIQFTDDVAVQLSEKSNVKLSEIKELFKLINLVSISDKISSDTLIQLNNKIENIYLKTGGYGK